LNFSNGFELLDPDGRRRVCFAQPQRIGFARKGAGEEIWVRDQVDYPV
jgi:hypothetical protein